MIPTKNVLISTGVGTFPGGSVVKNPPANVGDTSSCLIWEDPTCRGVTKPVCHDY